MYISAGDRNAVDEGRPPGRVRVPGTVVLLGVVSLLTDVSSEAVNAVLPLYLTAALGLSPFAYGVADGLYQGNRGPGAWRLTALELNTGVETELAEVRTVDDQAEWLDNEHVLYTVPRSGLTESSVSDIFVVPADGTGSPALLIPAAASPAVVR